MNRPRGEGIVCLCVSMVQSMHECIAVGGVVVVLVEVMDQVHSISVW